MATTAACNLAALAFSTALASKCIDASSSSLRILPTGQKAWRASTHIEEKQFDTKELRHMLTRGENYNKLGFGYKKEILKQMDVQYSSDLAKTLKENGFEYSWGNVTIKLAELYGF